MAQLSESSSQNAQDHAELPRDVVAGGELLNSNGEISQAPAGEQAAHHHDAKDRAEEIVDAIAVKVAAGAHVLTHRLLRFGSRAREAAQDFWAEVQNFRRGKRP